MMLVQGSASDRGTRTATNGEPPTLALYAKCQGSVGADARTATFLNAYRDQQRGTSGTAIVRERLSVYLREWMKFLNRTRKENPCFSTGRIEHSSRE